jgi:hypothetical protein
VCGLGDLCSLPSQFRSRFSGFSGMDWRRFAGGDWAAVRRVRTWFGLGWIGQATARLISPRAGRFFIPIGATQPRRVSIVGLASNGEASWVPSLQCTRQWPCFLTGGSLVQGQEAALRLSVCDFTRGAGSRRSCCWEGRPHWHEMLEVFPPWFGGWI